MPEPRSNPTLRSELQTLWNSLEECASKLVRVDTDRLEAMQENLQTITGILGIKLHEYNGLLAKEWAEANSEEPESDEETENENEQ